MWMIRITLLSMCCLTSFVGCETAPKLISEAQSHVEGVGRAFDLPPTANCKSKYARDGTKDNTCVSVSPAFIREHADLFAENLRLLEALRIRKAEKKQ